MPRKPRVHIEGAVYYITVYGNKNDVIFLNDDDRKKYLYLIEKYKKRFDFNLYAYVLMNDHLHLLAGVKNVPLSKIMQGIQLSYTKYFNKVRKSSGNVFAGRYRARICEDDENLLTLVKYIHLNPVRRGLSPTLDYAWSSHNHYLDYPGNKNDIVDTGVIMSHFSSVSKNALRQYKWYMVKRTPEIEYEVPALLRDAEDVEAIRGRTRNTRNGLMTMEKLIDYVTSAAGVSFEEMLVRKRVRKVVAARNLLIYLALNHGLATGEELSGRLNISSSRVTRGYYSVHENRFLRENAESIINKTH